MWIMSWSSNSFGLGGALMGAGQLGYGNSTWWRDALFELNSYAISRPMVGIYVLILLVYIVVVLPGIFLFLKKKDRMHYLREFLTAAALLFSAVIFVLGAKTRLTAPALNYVRVMEYGEGVVFDDIYISVQLPYRQEIDVDFDGMYEAVSLNLKNADTPGETFADEEERYELKRDERGTELLLKDSTVVLPMYFLLSSETEETAGISGQLSVENGTIEGTLLNTTGLDFKECVIVSGNETAVLGTCAEQVTVSDAALTEEVSVSNAVLNVFVDSLEETDGLLFVGVCENESMDFIQDGEHWDLSGVTLVVAPVGY